MEENQFLDAINNGSLDLVRELINDDATLINLVTEDEKSVFELSLEAGFTSIALLLIEEDTFNLNHKEHNPLRLAIDLGYIDIAEILLNKGANPNYRPKNISSALLLCLEKEYLSLAKLMVKKGAEVNIRNSNGWTPLIWASIKGRTVAVDFLLENKANIHICNNDGWNAITGAYFKKRTNIVDMLSQKGAVFSASYAEAALLSAYENGYLDIVDTLLNMKISPNISDDKGSLLEKAIQRGNDDLVIKLIDLGADVNGRTIDSMPLIAELATHGKNELILYFLKAGADINLASEKGRTALYMACAHYQVETVKLLLKNSSNVNASLTNGWTPLMIASQKGFLSIVKLLLEYKANKALKTDRGETAKEITLENAPRGAYHSLKEDTAYSDIAELLTYPGHFIDD